MNYISECVCECLRDWLSWDENVKFPDKKKNISQLLALAHSTQARLELRIVAENWNHWKILIEKRIRKGLVWCNIITSVWKFA